MTIPPSIVATLLMWKLDHGIDGKYPTHGKLERFFMIQFYQGLLVGLFWFPPGPVRMWAFSGGFHPAGKIRASG